MKLIIFLLFVLFIISLGANAIGFSSDFLVNSTMELMVGTSRIYNIYLQNPTDQEASLKVDYDKTYMKISNYQEIYTLAPKEVAYKISFNVTAPDTPGTFEVGYTVSEVEPAGGGGVPIRLKINRNFNIKITKNPKQFYINYEYLAYAVIIIAFSAYVFWEKKWKKPKRRKAGKF